MRPTIGRCSNRTTSKTSLLTLNEQRNLRFYISDAPWRTFVQKIFFTALTFSLKEHRNCLLTKHPSHGKVVASRGTSFSPRKKLFNDILSEKGPIVEFSGWRSRCSSFSEEDRKMPRRFGA